MQDKVHTNEERILKMRSLIEAARRYHEDLPTPSTESLVALADEVESSLDAIESYLLTTGGIRKKSARE